MARSRINMHEYIDSRRRVRTCAGLADAEQIQDGLVQRFPNCDRPGNLSVHRVEAGPIRRGERTEVTQGNSVNTFTNSMFMFGTRMPGLL